MPNPFEYVSTGITTIDQSPIGDADTYFKWVAPDTLQLWVNGEIRQSWTTAIVTPPAGSYMGFGLFTYS